MLHSDLTELLAERDWIAANAPHLTRTLYVLNGFEAHVRDSGVPPVAGRATVTQTFLRQVERHCTEAACRVTEGKVDIYAPVRVMRGEAPLYRGHLRVIHQGDNVMASVPAGQECLVQVVGFDALQKGDVIESLVVQQGGKHGS